MTLNILDDQARMQVRAQLEGGGAEVLGIDSARNGLQVRIRRGEFPRFLALCGRLGAWVQDQHFFPVGTEQVDDAFRHDASYPGSRGFTLNALVRFQSA